MKLLKDLSKEQAVEIAKLAYGQVDWIKSDFDFLYKPEEVRDDISVSEDSPEYVLISFKALTFGTTIDKIRLFIFSNYNLSMDIFRKDPVKMIPLGISNQVEIFKYLIKNKFIEV